MAVFKCKMCGGTIEFEKGSRIGVCDSCQVTQTLPKTEDEVIANHFNRANNLRLKSEFDKAAQIYEKILEENDQDAEAHWCLVLCKYGIEYVEDTKTSERIPTCHRTLFEPVTTDVDYIAAIECCDDEQRAIYEKEACAIDKIQKDTLAIVKNEKPFDVFICYKETDEEGKRTRDSAIANDIYYQLTQEGFKVFYAAITLEDKIGQEYEPYIFAALNSAKVMLVVGTKPEYFSAVWVKNEWSRFMKLMKDDRSKVLIPCYRDMDAYELPEEFSRLQAQDMNKIAFIQDLMRGVKKVIQPDVSKETVSATEDSKVAPLIKRAFLFLEDKDWNSAYEYCEKVLDIDPENAYAYLGKLMAELGVEKKENLKYCTVDLEDRNNYKKAIRFADDKLKTELAEYIDYINLQKENIRKDSILAQGKVKMSGENIYNYEVAINLFKSISGWKDADDNIQLCNMKIAEIKAKAKNSNNNSEKILKITSVNYNEAMTLIEKTALSFKRKNTIRKFVRPIGAVLFCLLALFIFFGVFFENSGVGDKPVLDRLDFLVQSWELYSDGFAEGAGSSAVFWIMMLASMFLIPLLFSAIVTIVVYLCVKEAKIEDISGDELAKAKKMRDLAYMLYRDTIEPDDSLLKKVIRILFTVMFFAFFIFGTLLVSSPSLAIFGSLMMAAIAYFLFGLILKFFFFLNRFFYKKKDISKLVKMTEDYWESLCSEV